MNETEHIENKEQSTDTGQDGILSAISAPIKSFSAAEVLQSLTAKYFNEEACRQWILETLHPDGAYCPACKNKITDDITRNNFSAMRRCKCKHCGKWFSATVGTILHNSQLSMRQAFALAVLISLGLGNKQIAKIIGIHPDSVRLWRLRLND